MKTKLGRQSKLRIETLSAALLGLAHSHKDQALTPELLSYWHRILADLTEEEFDRALWEYSTTLPDCKFWPQPGQIYALARRPPNLESEAALMVEDLYRLVELCSADSFGTARAKAKLPSITWAYVESRGGWSRFSYDMQIINQGDVLTAKAQTRKALLALIERQKQGRPLLGANTGLSNFADYAKKLLPSDDGRKDAESGDHVLSQSGGERTSSDRGSFEGAE